jgi:NAD(P)H-dependent FMN reductase
MHGVASPHRVLLVEHSRGGTTRELADELEAGVREGGGGEVVLRRLDAFSAGPEDVLWSEGVLLATPARFGYMSGALKDFFERVYHPCLEVTVGRPYGLCVKGDTDVAGAVASVERIVAGLRWRAVGPPATCVGPVDDGCRERARELGGVLAAGLVLGIY